MIKVKNQKAVARLSRRSLAANRTRNIIAVAAIALTSLLFTALFTIALTLLNTFEQQNMRQAGGYAHGTFKSVTREQMETLRGDPLVVRSGARLFLGMPLDPPFNKDHVEVSYMDADCADMSFCTPTTGRLPAEGTGEIACDTRVLQLLGVEPELGAEITLPYYLGCGTSRPQLVTGTFTLCGWWEYDQASAASMAVVPLSYAEQALAGYSGGEPNDMTGTWALNVMLKSASHIEADMNAILQNHGYQHETPSAGNYIAIGVNWSYLGAQVSGSVDPVSAAALISLLLIALATGYLIIYNIFRISVSNDIRFYGLLKTIGTTPRQLGRIVRRQALALSLVGIPIGLVLGYLVGSVLAPFALRATGYNKLYRSSSPLIFVFAVAFSLVTVMISCHKPGQLAGRVSPIEAVRYTEGAGGRALTRRSGTGSLAAMAAANLGRSKSKTALVVVSLALAVVLMQATYSFSNGFDMDKYLRQWVVTDFIFSDANYLNQSHTDYSLAEDDIAAVESTGLVAESGRIYGASPFVFVPEELYRDFYGPFYSEEVLQQQIDTAARDSSNRIAILGDLYGMESLALDQLQLLDGDTSALYDPSRRAVAAVYFDDDYGNAESDTNCYQVGDTVTLRYVSRWEMYDIRTGETYEGEDTYSDYINLRAAEYRDEEYRVVATVVVKRAMGFRNYGGPQFVMNAELYKQDVDSVLLMSYLINTQPDATEAMDEFLKDYTENIVPSLDYESKKMYVDEFESFRSMFLLLGGALSLVVGIVGVLNFLNAVLTSLMARRREFAVLQSIGMTGRQLKTMLVCEGILYALLAAAVSLVFSLLTGWLMDRALGGILWFFTYRFTLLPLLLITPVFVLLGVALPLVTYRFTARQSIVERLRQSE